VLGGFCGSLANYNDWAAARQAGTGDITTADCKAKDQRGVTSHRKMNIAGGVDWRRGPVFFQISRVPNVSDNSRGK